MLRERLCFSYQAKLAEVLHKFYANSIRKWKFVSIMIIYEFSVHQLIVFRDIAARHCGQLVNVKLSMGMPSTAIAFLKIWLKLLIP